MSGTTWVCCSAGRPEMLVKKTIATLQRGNFNGSLWVIVPHDELAAYSASLTGSPIHCILRAATKGLTNQRRYIREQMLPGTELVFIDDDIEAIKYLDNHELKHVASINNLADVAFQLMKSRSDDCLLAGVYPVANRLWMSQRVTESNAYIAGALYFLINDERVPEPVDDELEDYNRQLCLQAAMLPTLRINWIGIQTQYFKNPGGLQTLRNVTSRRAAVFDVVSRYPTLVQQKTRRDGTLDLKFLARPVYWKVAISDPSPTAYPTIPEEDQESQSEPPCPTEQSP